MNTILETAISLVLIFFIFSIITYVIQELIAVNLKYRSKMLWKSMSQLFDNLPLPGRMNLVRALPTTGVTDTTAFYNHVEIKTLHQNLNKKPSYIPSANFALAVLDLVASKVPATAKTNDLFKDVKTGLQTYVTSNGNIYKVLKNLLDTSADIKELQKKLEDWFNNYMHRVTGWYQSHAVISVRIIAIVVTLIFNINVINLAKVIYKDGQLRSGLVALADNVVDHPETVTKYYSKTFDQQNASLISQFDQQLAQAHSRSDSDAILHQRSTTLDSLAAQYTRRQLNAIDTLTAKLKATGLPLGWRKTTLQQDIIKGKTCFWDILINCLVALAGWIIGACCISMGAPFWFDMLNKLVNVRRTGIKPTAK
jgi:hypothetical protein